MIRSGFVLLMALAAVLSGCRDIFVKPAGFDENLADFEATWHRVGDVYPFLGLKEIDWDALYGVYRKRAEEARGDEFIQVLSDLLGELRDGHTYLKVPGGDRIYPWYPQRQTKDRHLYDPFVVRLYFDNELTVTESGSAEYGITADNIGYIFLSDFHENYYILEFSGIMAKLQNTRGLIIDIRQKQGGSLQNIEAVVSHFSESPITLPQFYLRGDKVPLPPVQPRQPLYLLKPVMVLVNGSTFSAGEITTEIMKQLQWVTVIGDTTGGGGVASSGTGPGTKGEYRLPSGKTVYIGTGWFARYDGEPFEWSGIVPDIVAPNKPEEMEQGIDRQLQLALDMIRFVTNGKE